MIETKEVAEWLAKLGKTGPQGRAWLSEQMNVSSATVKGWLLAGRPITGPAETLIRILMQPTPSMNPEFSVDEWEQIEDCAKAEGISPREWMKKELKKAIALEYPKLKPATIIKGPFSGFYPHPNDGDLKIAEP